MIKCNVCESEFIPRIGEHYISRDNQMTGLTTVVSNSEVKIYDTFDCPVCGCQVAVKERKRVYESHVVTTLEIDPEVEDDE